MKWVASTVMAKKDCPKLRERLKTSLIGQLCTLPKPILQGVPSEAQPLIPIRNDWPTTTSILSKKILKHLSISQNDWPTVEHYRIVLKIILNHSKTFWKVDHSGTIFTQPLVVKQICQSSQNGTNGYSSDQLCEAVLLPRPRERAKKPKM